MTTIYAYTKDNQAYIGQTRDVSDRKSHHKYRHFGNWDFKELDVIPSLKAEDWKPYEVAWIQIYKEWGYELINLNDGGNGRRAFRTDEEKKEYRSQYNKSLKHKESMRRSYLKYIEKKKEYMRQYNMNKKLNNV